MNGLADAFRAGWLETPSGTKSLLLAAWIATAVLVLGTLLTWYHASIVSVSGVSTGAGKFTLLLAIASVAAAGAVLARKLPSDPTWLALASTHLGLTAFLLVIAFRYHRAMSNAFAGAGIDNPMAAEMSRQFNDALGSVGVGFGLWLCVLTALVTAGAYAAVAVPSLVGLRLPADPRRMGLMLGIGLAVGLVVGAIC